MVFNIGEIDVREGFWKSLERDRYDSLTEGMERTVDIYTKVLLKILATKKFNVSDFHELHWSFNWYMLEITSNLRSFEITASLNLP